MAVVLRTVCVFSVFLALDAAPTVTYDQRQQGEYNLQVDLDDVAIVFLPGGEFRQKNALADRVHQLFGRHNGVTGHSKKKHKPTTTAANCGGTAATTPAYTTAKPVEVPENEYGETPALYASNRSPTNPAPVTEPAGPDGENHLGYYDPYSVTPNTPNIFKNDVFEAGTVEGSTGMVQAAKPVVGAGDAVTAELPEMVAVKTVDKPAAVDASKEFPADANNPAAVDDTAFDGKPVSVPSDVKTVEKTSHSGETVESGETPVTDEKSSNAMTAVKIADEPAEQEAENAAKVTTTNTKPEDNKQVEGIDTKTVDVPAKPVAESAASAQQVQDAKNVSEPLEMVAMKTMETPAVSEALKVAKKPAAAIADKTAVPEAADDVPTFTSIDPNKKPAETKTMEKPSFAEALKAAKKPSDAAAIKNAAVPKPGVGAATIPKESSNKPVEMVAVKTAEIPSNMWSVDSVEKSEGIMTSTKLVEIQDEKKIPSDPAAVETIISRAAPKLTEMVAVKTVENPATVTTVKSVTSVKTVIKSGTSKSTVSSNGSSILRKVGDRKPLPSITMEIATPKVV